MNEGGGAVETEWYNGNVSATARDRILHGIDPTDPTDPTDPVAIRREGGS